MLGVLRLIGCIQARAVWKALNYPIFVPKEDPDIATLLRNGEASKLAEVLNRRASLGSGSAAALLGFLELMGAFSGKPNPEAAIACCTVPSKAGNPYAQYVLSWVYWERGDRTGALGWMKRSAVDAKFLPAWVSLGRMLLTLAGDDAEVRAAIGVLWRAHRLGHIAALPLICEVARRGHLGPTRRVLFGIILFPYAVIRGAFVMHCDPFGARSFTYIRKPNVPFFTRKSMASAEESAA